MKTFPPASMAHIIVFGYIFVVLIGIICLSIGVFFYLKIHSKFLLNFLIYFSSFTIFIFSYLVVLTYLNANLKQPDFYVLLLVLGVILFSYSFLLFSILHFGHFLVYGESEAKRNYVEILIGFVALIGMIFSFKVNWNDEQIYQVKNFGLVVSIALLFLVVGYLLILKIYHLKNIDDDKKLVLKQTSIMNVIFIPGFTFDLYLTQTQHFSLFLPVFYSCYSILFLRYFIKKYNADFTIIKSIGDSQTYDNFLTQAGISIREKEIIALIMKGFSNRKIASQLFISLSTVKTHIRNIFQKFNVTSRFEIITKLKDTQQN